MLITGSNKYERIITSTHTHKSNHNITDISRRLFSLKKIKVIMYK